MKYLGLLITTAMVFLSPVGLAGEAEAGALAPANVPDSPTSLQATGDSSSPDWLEPRGLNIVDLVGRVPEEHLEGAIISYTPGYGILTYESGTRTRDIVTVRATVYPRYVEDGTWSGSMFGCLGQPARIDQWGSVAPATTMRLYHGSKDVTSQVDLYSYVPAGQNLPVRNPVESQNQNRYRYWERGEASALSTEDEGLFTSNGTLQLPANMGCELVMSYTNYEQLTAVFTAEVQELISVDVVGTESFTFRSYLGPGAAGLLSPLVDQLNARYEGRHDKFTLDVPSDADYLLLNFPPTPVDVYTQFPANPYDNVDRPSAGTYRIEREGSVLSVDHVNAMGLPLYAHWEDLDYSQGGTYLPRFRQPRRLASPEYFVPDGVAYNPCMRSGTCPGWLLEQIRNTSMTMTAVYMRVEQTGNGMDRISLKMVGPEWDPHAAGAASTATLDGNPRGARSVPSASAADADELNVQVYIPLVLRHLRNDVPYGWFTADGRMLDFVPAQE